MNKTVHVNSDEENGPKFYERNKNISTTIYESSSQTVSLRNHGGKRNSFPRVYEIFDVRSRKKVQK